MEGLKRYFDRKPVEELPGLFLQMQGHAKEVLILQMLFRSWSERAPESAATNH